MCADPTSQRDPESSLGGRSVSVTISEFRSYTRLTCHSVQLRPTVRKMGRILEFDVSLLERLYTNVESPIIQKTMLNVSLLCRLLNR